MYALKNSTIYTGCSIETKKVILIEEETIIDLIDEKDLPSDIRAIDLKGNNVAPGFIDIQVYGGGDSLFFAEPTKKSLEKIHADFLKSGTTHFLITIPTISDEMVKKCIKAAQEYIDEGGKGLIGLHLEGPFINSSKKGAHIEKFIQSPSIQHLEELIKEGGDVIRMITLAPEHCTDECIQLLQDHNIIISAGHSNATFNQAKEAFSKGITTCTHLFNAMSTFSHREPGLVGAIYDSPDVYASIIPDGYHTDFASVRISKKIMQNRLFIITDAVVENLSGDYIYKLDSEHFVTENGTLAGSSLTMMRAVKNCIEKADLEVEEALRMASLYPSKVVNMDHYLGKIKAGYAADFVIFDDDYNVKYTIYEGKITEFDNN
ncbi:N-acetylglucosamine-6-phosphate deacetylase [Solitalea koreensis]|uniref:N-acetylglucosamine 6-phosphate deacetylase n=1 Tax=Solitalea koreensis TaxID=543615 RepID=A0A521BFT8_9SPHI|nr:N-acetylglucosamine-6-phosphate deacetylase [Solitalea koreensis]SMO45801.1 N-acetylglucosamine 6-phosphate deacetylase [Solitalea koreensis]